MFISCPRRQETNQRNAAWGLCPFLSASKEKDEKNAAWGWGGFTQAKALKNKERRNCLAFA